MKTVVMLRSVRGAVALATAALLAGCSGPAPAGQPAPAADDRPRVVVAFYPLQFVTERVGGSAVEVSTLTQPGAEPHDLELTPRQVAEIAEADLVVYTKGFQPAVDEAVAQSGARNVLETTEVVPLAAVSTPHTHNEDEMAEGPEEEGGHSEEEGAEHAEEGHEHSEGGRDPHFWLDPTTLVTLSGAVRDRLSALDADGATTYAENRRQLTVDLADLDADLRAGLVDCDRREFITTHDAFGYLARRYSLEQIPVGGLSPNAEPSPSRIADVQAEVVEHGITTIFYETLVSPAVAKSMAADLQVRTDVLDPVEGITAESKGQDYVAVMRANLAALEKAGACR